MSEKSGRPLPPDRYFAYVDWDMEIDFTEQGELVHPEFASSGPQSFDLRGLRTWRFGLQKFKGTKVAGTSIFTFLGQTGALPFCLGMQEGCAIQDKGVDVFTRVFGDNSLSLWKSIFWSQTPNNPKPQLWVPILWPDKQKDLLELSFCPLTSWWNHSCLTPHFECGVPELGPTPTLIQWNRSDNPSYVFPIFTPRLH